VRYVHLNPSRRAVDRAWATFDDSGAMMEISRRRMLQYGLGGLVLTAAGCKPVFAPSSPTAPTTTTAKPSGLSRWSDPATWGGAVPQTGDPVVVDRPVLLDANPVVGTLRIAPGGSLTFDPAASHVLESRGNFVVQGMLVMEPAQPSVSHRLLFSGVDESKFVGGGMSPLDSDVGLWVMDNGMLHICGSERAGWARSVVPITAGAKAVQLDRDPTGWRVGDELVVCPSHSPGETGDFETVRLSSLAGRIVTFDKPLAFSHPSVTLRDGSKLGTELLNLTRNVEITGQPGKRAHVFIHSMMAQDICHATFQHLGPQQPNDFNGAPEGVLGRYAVHFHHCGDGSRRSTVESCVVRDCGSHAYVPHASHGVTFSDCVSYNTVTPAYWWDHIGKDPAAASNDTLYDRCVAAKVQPDGNEFRYTNSGFRMTFGEDLSNSCRKCVAVGVEGPDSSGFRWDSDEEAVWVFEDNVAHNNDHGVGVWQNDDLPHKIVRLITYRNGTGIGHGAYGNSYVYDGFQVIDNDTSIHITAVSDYAGQKWLNGYVDAANRGQCMRFPDGGPVTPQHPTIVHNCDFRNASGAFLYIFADRGDEKGANTVEASSCTFTGSAPKTGEESGVAAASKITVV
jgi:hypothetical protein